MEPSSPLPCSSKSVCSYEQSFECCICFDIFQAPRIIPCGHSFCGPPKECLLSILKPDKAQCPLCRTRIVAKTKSPQNYPLNYSLISAIENMKSKNSKGKKKNSTFPLCNKHKMELDIYCRKCDAAICKSCWMELHSENDKHDITPFSNYIKERIGTEMERCESHMTELKMENIENVYHDAINEFITVGDMMRDTRTHVKEVGTTQKNVMTSKTIKEVDEKIELLKQSLEVENSMIWELRARIQSIKASLDTVSMLLNETAPQTTVNSSPFIGENIPLFDSSSSNSSSNRQPVPTFDRMTRPRWSSVSEGGRDCMPHSFSIRASSAVQIGRTHPLLRAVADSSSTIFCLSWFGIAYKVHTCESGIFSRNTELKSHITTIPTWHNREDKTTLLDIAICNNTLYGVISDHMNGTCSVHALNKDHLTPMKKINYLESSEPLKIAGNYRILAVLRTERNVIFIYDGEKFVQSVRLSGNEDICQITSFVFSNDYLLLQSFANKKVILIKWEDEIRITRSHWFGGRSALRSYCTSQPLVKDIPQNSDCMVLTVYIGNQLYKISRASNTISRQIQLENLTEFLTNENSQPYGVIPFNNDVLGPHDSKLGLSLLCEISRNTVLCQERFRNDENYSIYLLTVREGRSIQDPSFKTSLANVNEVQSSSHQPKNNWASRNT